MMAGLRILLTQLTGARRRMGTAVSGPFLAAILIVAPAIAQETASSTAGAKIDPSDVQIVFADLQPSLIGGSATVPPDDLARSAAVLAEVATILDIPMTFSIAPQGDKPARVIDALSPYATEAKTISRRSAGALIDPFTAEALARTERPILVVAGFASEVVVLQTVLDAVQDGYTVYYAVDAIGGLSERSEQAMFLAMEAAGARPTSVVSLAARLAPDFSRPPGTEILTLIRRVISE